MLKQISFEIIHLKHIYAWQIVVFIFCQIFWPIIISQRLFWAVDEQTQIQSNSNWISWNSSIVYRWQQYKRKHLFDRFPIVQIFVIVLEAWLIRLRRAFYFCALNSTFVQFLFSTPHLANCLHTSMSIRNVPIKTKTIIHWRKCKKKLRNAIRCLRLSFHERTHLYRWRYVWNEKK